MVRPCPRQGGRGQCREWCLISFWVLLTVCVDGCAVGIDSFFCDVTIIAVVRARVVEPLDGDGCRMGRWPARFGAVRGARRFGACVR
jgi:hypothetical protein